MLRVVVADPHPLVLDGVASLIRSSAPDIEWSGAATGWADLTALVNRAPARPHVVVVEPALGSPAECTAGVRELAGRGIAVVAFTGDLRPVPIRRAVEAGARSVVLKRDPAPALLDAIRCAATGEFSTSGPWARSLVFDSRLTPRLAPREEEVLHLLASGMPRKVIGRHMSPPVALTTVVTYLNRICEKYRELGRNVACPADAMRAAAEDGFLDLGGSYPATVARAAS